MQDKYLSTGERANYFRTLQAEGELDYQTTQVEGSPTNQLSPEAKTVINQEYQERLKHYEQVAKQMAVGLPLEPCISFIRRVGDEHAEQIYQWYAQAMVRRQGRVPLELGRFQYHFFANLEYEPNFIFGDPERGYVLGPLNFGVFTPTHFAPRTLRGGYDLFEDLSDHPDLPAVLAVTEDLAATLVKFKGWRLIDTSFLARFGGQSVQKSILINAHPQTPQLALGLVARYLNEQEK